MLNAQQKSVTEDVVAEISFANGLSFNVTHSPQYREMMMKVIVAGPSFQPPSYNKMRTALLDRWGLKDARGGSRRNIPQEELLFSS